MNKNVNRIGLKEKTFYLHSCNDSHSLYYVV